MAINNSGVIVEYLDSLSNQVVTRLNYTTGVLANNEWNKISLSPDCYQPEAWGPNETITLEALLSPTQKTESTATVSITTPNGVSVDWSFGSSGFFWFTDALDISLITALSWQDIDLTYEVPEGTTGAIVEIMSKGIEGTQKGVVRGKDDTREYMSNTNYQTVEDETHRWQIVKVDVNRVIQGYVEYTQLDFKLIGYTMGTDPSFFNPHLDVTSTIDDEWTNADLSAFVDADADGVILFILSTQNDDRDYGVREIGSSFSTKTTDQDNRSSTKYVVGIDDNDQFEVYHEDYEDVKFYLVGQTKGLVVYYSGDLAGADPATGSSQEIGADTYSVRAVANGLILRVTSTGDDRISGIRHGDSTDIWTPNVCGALTYKQLSASAIAMYEMST